ncbi:hypothetical protein BUY93_09735, partial [Mammaliicoccus fleurettii]
MIMLDIVIAIICIIVSLLLAIYISYSKNLKIIASIDHEKIKAENKNKIAYIFSICLVIGTIFIAMGYIINDFNFYLSMLMILI